MLCLLLDWDQMLMMLLRLHTVKFKLQGYFHCIAWCILHAIHCFESVCSYILDLEFMVWNACSMSTKCQMCIQHDHFMFL